MKKLLSALLCAALLFSITACGSSHHTSSDERDTTESESVVETGTTENESATETEEAEVKTAVVCFSGTGNTMAVAETIADVTGGDLFEIRNIIIPNYTLDSPMRNRYNKRIE